MATYLLSWNPEKWNESFLSELVENYKLGNKLLRWSCGNTKKIRAGDRIFLMKRGEGEKGLFGSGYVSSDQPFLAKHFSSEIEDEEKKSLFIMIEFDVLIHPNEKIIIERDVLINSFSSKVWSSQGSGKTISPSIATELEKLWLERTGGVEIHYPDEIEADETFIEGAKKKVYVNSYERNALARLKCIQHHGASCCICGFHFVSFYGELARGKDSNSYIHVHHLNQLSSIGAEYKVDPIKDLRPVCPNCHAMLHVGKNPVSIEDLEKRVDLYGQHIRYKKM